MDMLTRRRMLEGAGSISADPILENNDWATISAVSRAGKAQEFWSVGDTKTFRMDGYTFTAQIMAFDWYDATDSGSYGRDKVGIVFQTRETNDTLLTQSQALSTANTLVTGSADIKDYIVTFNYLRAGTTYSSKGIVPSAVELTGQYSTKNEGTQYTFYANGGSKQRKTVAGRPWFANQWTRTKGTTYYYTWDGSGSGNLREGYDGREDNIAPVFCV